MFFLKKINANTCFMQANSFDWLLFRWESRPLLIYCTVGVTWSFSHHLIRHFWGLCTTIDENKSTSTSTLIFEKTNSSYILFLNLGARVRVYIVEIGEHCSLLFVLSVDWLLHGIRHFRYLVSHFLYAEEIDQISKSAGAKQTIRKKFFASLTTFNTQTYIRMHSLT